MFATLVVLMDANQQVGSCLSEVAFGTGWKDSADAELLLRFCEATGTVLPGACSKCVASESEQDNATWSSAAAPGLHRIDWIAMDAEANCKDQSYKVVPD